MLPHLIETNKIANKMCIASHAIAILPFHAPFADKVYVLVPVIGFESDFVGDGMAYGIELLFLC